VREIWTAGLKGLIRCALFLLQPAGNHVQVPVGQPVCSAVNNPSSERSTGSHASGPSSHSAGSQHSTEPSGSPKGGTAGSNSLRQGLLNLAAAAEQGAWNIYGDRHCSRHVAV
jgi:hypothetical protein